MQIAPRQILSYRYKKERSVAFKICQNPFSAGALPRTPLGELRTLPRPPSRLGREHPLPIPYSIWHQPTFGACHASPIIPARSTPMQCPVLVRLVNQSEWRQDGTSAAASGVLHHLTRPRRHTRTHFNKAPLSDESSPVRKLNHRANSDPLSGHMTSDALMTTTCQPSERRRDWVELCLDT